MNLQRGRIIRWALPSQRALGPRNEEYRANRRMLQYDARLAEECHLKLCAWCPWGCADSVPDGCEKEAMLVRTGNRWTRIAGTGVASLEDPAEIMSSSRFGKIDEIITVTYLPLTQDLYHGTFYSPDSWLPDYSTDFERRMDCVPGDSDA